MRRAAFALVAAALVAGCGGSSGGGKGAPPGEQRAATLTCLKEEDIPAREVERGAIEVRGPRGPRIEFLGSTSAAEQQQFSGKAQTAEQIENALLFVRTASDEELEKIENCVADSVS